MTEREKVVEVISRLFYYTDQQDWEGLKSEVFTTRVKMDMTSLGAPDVTIKTSEEICDEWSTGFKDLDAVHHQSGNFMIDLQEQTATAKVHAIASHYKKNAKEGLTREFVGSYDFHFTKTDNAWRMDSFKFNLKYMSGNLELK
ncbi:MAG: nuclear transport factor 2 family protein [Ekhidna sp.]|nr:nuclear transport factor 2 family protein [Ekhidna sp.]